jgi:DNA repair protein RadC
MAIRHRHTIPAPSGKAHPAPHTTKNNAGPQRSQQPCEIFGSYLRTADETNSIVRAMISQRTVPHFVIFYLDEEHRLLAYTVLADGPQSLPMISKRDLFQRAFDTNASAIMLARYHPEGAALSIPVDAGTLRQWRDAGQNLDIPILDMLIVTEQDFLSLRYGPQVYCR